MHHDPPPQLEPQDTYRYLLPKEKQPGMRVDGMVYSSPALVELLKTDQAVTQVANVAHLPGILGRSLAMPDIHWGYGFPIGGVAAMDLTEGVVSPGGVGYDINCGVRLVRTDLMVAEVRPLLKRLMSNLDRLIPTGLGAKGYLRDRSADIDAILAEGAEWCIEKGYGWEEDLEVLESRGRLEGADPGAVSDRAKARGQPQVGSLGAGNHFIEVQRVERILDEEAAKVFDLAVDQVVIMVHTGSRGCGYQIADDYIKRLRREMKQYDIRLPDEQLACVPIESPTGQAYLGAMQAGANFAWANRQLLVDGLRRGFAKTFGRDAEELGMRTVYDVAHNLAKQEEHVIDGQRQQVLVHRKGATRAFPADHPEVPLRYREVGQPVIIPGDMGTASYVLAGLPSAMTETFGSSCHGAGRIMSRSKARRNLDPRQELEKLSALGIVIRTPPRSRALTEEAPQAYKDIDAVIEVVVGAGISRPVARMTPMGVLKG